MSAARIPHWFLAVIVSLAVTLGARVASATPNFPEAIQKRLGAAKKPDCSICHVCGVTGRGTVNTPWGSAVRARGLVEYDESSLDTALAAMETDKVDSNGDGVIDVDAVRMGLNPNPPSSCGAADDPTTPTYGCFGRIAPSGTGNSNALFVVGVVIVAGALRRRRIALTSVLLLALGTATLSACTSGAPLAPRDELFEPKRVPAPPRTAPVAQTKLAGDLGKIGLDVRHLPAFEALKPRQVRALMSTFTRSLGYACTDCHDASNYRLRTRAIAVTIHMWNEMTAPYAFHDGGALYCDSCHQGQGKFLARADETAVETYMNENYTDQMSKVGGTSTIGCSDCHGSPMDPVILAKWR